MFYFPHELSNKANKYTFTTSKYGAGQSGRKPQFDF